MLTSMLDCDEPEDGSSAAVIGPPVQATVVCDGQLQSSSCQ